MKLNKKCICNQNAFFDEMGVTGDIHLKNAIFNTASFKSVIKANNIEIQNNFHSENVLFVHDDFIVHNILKIEPHLKIDKKLYTHDLVYLNNLEIDNVFIENCLHTSFATINSDLIANSGISTKKLETTNLQIEDTLFVNKINVKDILQIPNSYFNQTYDGKTSLFGEKVYINSVILVNSQNVCIYNPFYLHSALTILDDVYINSDLKLDNNALCSDVYIHKNLIVNSHVYLNEVEINSYIESPFFDTNVLNVNNFFINTLDINQINIPEIHFDNLNAIKINIHNLSLFDLYTKNVFKNYFNSNVDIEHDLSISNQLYLDSDLDISGNVNIHDGGVYLQNESSLIFNTNSLGFDNNDNFSIGGMKLNSNDITITSDSIKMNGNIVVDSLLQLTTLDTSSDIYVATDMKIQNMTIDDTSILLRQNSNTNITSDNIELCINNDPKVISNSNKVKIKNVTYTDSLFVNDYTEIRNNLFLNYNLYSKSLYINSDTTLKENIIINSTSTLDNSVFFNSILIFQSHVYYNCLLCNNCVIINSNLHIDGRTHLGNLKCSKDVVINQGDLNIDGDIHILEFGINIKENDTVLFESQSNTLMSIKNSQIINIQPDSVTCKVNVLFDNSLNINDNLICHSIDIHNIRIENNTINCNNSLLLFTKNDTTIYGNSQLNIKKVMVSNCTFDIDTTWNVNKLQVNGGAHFASHQTLDERQNIFENLNTKSLIINKNNENKGNVEYNSGVTVFGSTFLNNNIKINGLFEIDTNSLTFKHDDITFYNSNNVGIFIDDSTDDDAGIVYKDDVWNIQNANLIIPHNFKLNIGPWNVTMDNTDNLYFSFGRFVKFKLISNMNNEQLDLRYMTTFDEVHLDTISIVNIFYNVWNGTFSNGSQILKRNVKYEMSHIANFNISKQMQFHFHITPHQSNTSDSCLLLIYPTYSYINSNKMYLQISLYQRKLYINLHQIGTNNFIRWWCKNMEEIVYPYSYEIDIILKRMKAEQGMYVDEEYKNIFPIVKIKSTKDNELYYNLANDVYYNEIQNDSPYRMKGLSLDTHEIVIGKRYKSQLFGSNFTGNIENVKIEIVKTKKRVTHIPPWLGVPMDKILEDAQKWYSENESRPSLNVYEYAIRNWNHRHLPNYQRNIAVSFYEEIQTNNDIILAYAIRNFDNLPDSQLNIVKSWYSNKYANPGSIVRQYAIDNWNILTSYHLNIVKSWFIDNSNIPGNTIRDYAISQINALTNTMKMNLAKCWYNDNSTNPSDTLRQFAMNNWISLSSYRLNIVISWYRYEYTNPGNTIRQYAIDNWNILSSYHLNIVKSWFIDNLSNPGNNVRNYAIDNYYSLTTTMKNNAIICWFNSYDHFKSNSNNSQKYDMISKAFHLINSISNKHHIIITWFGYHSSGIRYNSQSTPPNYNSTVLSYISSYWNYFGSHNTATNIVNWWYSSNRGIILNSASHQLAKSVLNTYSSRLNFVRIESGNRQMHLYNNLNPLYRSQWYIPHPKWSSIHSHYNYNRSDIFSQPSHHISNYTGKIRFEKIDDFYFYIRAQSNGAYLLGGNWNGDWGVKWSHNKNEKAPGVWANNTHSIWGFFPVYNGVVIASKHMLTGSNSGRRHVIYVRNNIISSYPSTAWQATSQWSEAITTLSYIT